MGCLMHIGNNDWDHQWGGTSCPRGSKHKDHMSSKVTGNRDDLPQDIAAALTDDERRRVVYWSRPDPTLPLCRSMFCQHIGSSIFLPCFWPHMLILSGPAACMLMNLKKAVVHNVIVVTDRTVEMITLAHSLPGMYRKSVQRNTIGAEIIRNVNISAHYDGCMSSYFS